MMDYTQKLFSAAFDGDVVKIRKLLKKGADANTKNYTGETPLHFATRFGYTEVVEALIEAGADVNAKGSYGQTPLFVAISLGHMNVLKALLKAGAEYDIKHEGMTGTALSAAKMNGHGDEVLYILSNHEINVEKQNLLNDRLFDAVYKNDAKTIKKLIVDGANPNTKNHTGGTLLHEAAFSGGLEAISALVASGANVNAQDKKGRTPLYLVASYEQEEGMAKRIDVMRALLDLGADPNIPDKDGKTTVHRVVSSLYIPGKDDDLTMINREAGVRLDEFLLVFKQGANVNVADMEGNAVLHSAVAFRNKEAVKILVDDCDNINLQNKYGDTALHVAARVSDVEMVKLLIAKGARTDIRNSIGELPSDIVKKKDGDLMNLYPEECAEILSELSKAVPSSNVEKKPNKVVVGSGHNIPSVGQGNKIVLH